VRLRVWLLALSVSLAGVAHASCDYPVLAQEKKDEATIQQLEHAWSVAFLTGDTDFEACLLSPDFAEIRSDGNLHRLSDELALAAKHKGKPMPNIDIPPGTVHLHGDVAVAYGISPVKMVDGKPHQSYYADYYVWENGSWRVYFAQQTAFTPAQ
jgi:hypothetical protein